MQIHIYCTRFYIVKFYFMSNMLLVVTKIFKCHILFPSLFIVHWWSKYGPNDEAKLDCLLIWKWIWSEFSDLGHEFQRPHSPFQPLPFNFNQSFTHLDLGWVLLWLLLYTQRENHRLGKVTCDSPWKRAPLCRNLISQETFFNHQKLTHTMCRCLLI